MSRSERESVPRLLVSLAVVGLLAACGGGDTDSEPGPGDPDATTGTIEIDATPDALGAPWTLARPGAADTSGTGDATLAGVPPGTYALTWGDVDGWNTPPGAERSLVAGGTAAFGGVYTEMGQPTAIIVDHRAVVAFDNGDIPARWIEEVKNRGVLLHFPGRSHAQQIVGDLDGDPVRHIGGLMTLAAEDPTYAAAIACDLADLPQDGALRVLKGQYDPDDGTLVETWECRYDDREYWATERGRLMTEATAAHAAAQGDPIDASFFGWSYHLLKPGSAHAENNDQITFDDERRDAYLAAIARFNGHPSGTVFGYGTAPVDDGYGGDGDYVGEDGWRATRYNADFRAAALAAGGVLFDQADIENWNRDFTARRSESWDGHQLELRHQEWDGGDCAHGGMGICVAKAKAIWWLAARLAGWDGVPE